MSFVRSTPWGEVSNVKLIEGEDHFKLTVCHFSKAYEHFVDNYNGINQQSKAGYNSNTVDWYILLKYTHSRRKSKESKHF